MTAPTRLLTPNRMLLTYKSGLVRYFAFCEGGGLAAYDFSPLLEHGSLLPLASEPTWTADGKLGNALVFDGLSYLTCYVSASGPEFTSAGGFTVSFWFKPAIDYLDLAIGWYGGIATSGWANFKGFILGWEGWNDRWNFGVETPADDDDRMPFAAGGKMVAGNWYFITVTYKNGVARYYEDGFLLDTQTLPTDQDPVIPYTMRVGTTYRGGCLNGIVDEVRIFNRDLSAEEIFDEYFSAVRGW